MPSVSATLASSPHAALIKALQAADPETAIERAYQQITTRGGDVPLLIATADALGRAGLAGMAERLLAATPQGVQQHPDIVTLREMLAHEPSGEIAPAVRQQRFDDHRALLITRSSAHANTLASLAAPDDRFAVYHSRAGNVHALRLDAGSTRFDPVFPFVDHRAGAATLRMPPVDLASSFLLIGVPSPHLLARLLLTNTSGYRPPIDILESDPEILALWLCMLENGACLKDARIGIFAGEQAFEHYAGFIVNTPSRAPATCVLTNQRPNWQGGGPPRIDAARLAMINDRMRQRDVALRSQMDVRLSSRDAAFWQRRFAEAGHSAPPLRIVGFTNRYSTVVQHAMRDLAAAFRHKGHNFDIVSQPNDHSASVDVAGTLVAREFDLIVAVNHLRHEFPHAMPRNMPYVGWIQDHMDHLWRREAGATLGELDLVITHQPHVLSGLYGYREDRLVPSSNLTDPHTYSAEALPEDELVPYRCDLSFVSHGAATPQALVNELGAATNPALHRLFSAFLCLATQRMNDAGCINAKQLVELMLSAERESRCPGVSPAVRRAHVYPQIARIHDRLFRHQTLEWAAKWARSRGRRLRIYGRGWEEHPTLREFACGEVGSGQELRAVYHASRISLQANGYSSLHQRLLDGVACGAMVVSRYNPADFVRQPFAAIQRAINDHRLTSLAEILRLRERDPAFALLCDEAERLSGAVIALADDPRRREHVRMLREGNDIPELQTDEGLFAMLRGMRFIPTRVAADLSGFDQTVFRTEGEMHALLDRLVDDEVLRRSIAMPMREAVLQHDTFDALADRIIAVFAAGKAPCAGC